MPFAGAVGEDEGVETSWAVQSSAEDVAKPGGNDSAKPEQDSDAAAKSLSDPVLPHADDASG